MTEGPRPARTVAALGLLLLLALGLGALIVSPGPRPESLPARLQPAAAGSTPRLRSGTDLAGAAGTLALGAPGALEARLPLASASAIGPRHRIQVVDADGAPLAGSFVRPRYEVTLDAAVVGGETRGTRRADADGWIEVPVWSGPELVAEAGLALVLSARAGARNLRGRLDAPGVAARAGQRYPKVVLAGLRTLAAGRVTESCGRPLGGALVLGWWEAQLEGPGRTTAPERPADFSFRTEDDGRFEFRGQGEGVLLLHASRAGWPRVALTRAPVPRRDLELVAHRQQGLRGSLVLPPEVGDLRVHLEGRGTRPRFFQSELGPGGRSLAWGQFRVGHGACFEMPTAAKSAELWLYNRFHLWSGEIPPDTTVDLPAAALAPELVPLELQVFDGELEVHDVQFTSPAFEGGWSWDLSKERRLVLPPEAFPLTVHGPDGGMAQIERRGGYRRRVGLGAALALWLELELPEGARSLPLRVRLKRVEGGTGAAADSGSAAAEFYVEEGRALLSVLEPGVYLATLLLPETGAPPEEAGRIEGFGVPEITYRELPVAEVALGTLEFELQFAGPPVIERLVGPDRLPALRALERGENPWGADRGRGQGWRTPWGTR